MGPEFEKEHPTKIYWGLIYGFYSYNLSLRRTREKDKVIVRFKTANDILPKSLEGCLQESRRKYTKRK